MARKKKGIPGASFSWKRASGLSAAKSKLSKELGVPLTKSGRQRKVGRAMGCCLPAAIIVAGGGMSVYEVSKLLF